MMTTQKQVRAAFWRDCGTLQGVSRKKINGEYKTDTRCAFCDYVDTLARNGEISEELAQRVTL